jgi:hypothetical protein
MMTGKNAPYLYNAGVYNHGAVITPITDQSTAACADSDGVNRNRFTSDNAKTCHTVCDDEKNCETRLLSSGQYEVVANGVQFNCQLNCGGIALVDKTKGFIAPGKVVIKGYSVGADLEQKPQRGESSVKFTYDPL